VHGFSRPLPALYTARLADLADQLLRQGRAGPRALLAAPGVRVRWLDMAAIQAVDPDLRSFLEANTPEQWQALLDLDAANLGN
jgi:molybdopterin-guanine dinucleotide biosynthesis protein A